MDSKIPKDVEFKARNQLSFLSRVLNKNIEYIQTHEQDGSLTAKEAMVLVRLNTKWKQDIQQSFRDILDEQYGQ